MAAVNDDFNRGNSSSLGANWTELGGVGDWEIAANKLQCNTDAGALGYYARFEADVGSSDMFAQAVVTSTQASANSNTGVLVRGRTAALTSYQIDIRHAGDILWFWRVVAGAETQLTNQLGTTSLSVPSASGDTVRGEVVGSLIRAKINGALVGLCRDTNITDGQRAGVNGWNEVGTDVVEVDDFAGGALAADGGLLAPYIVGVSDQVTGTGTTLTPTVPPVIANGDLVLVQTTSRDAAQTMTAPPGEGWVSQQSPSQTGLEDVVWAKVWGLVGQTDDTTPTFGIGSGTAGWGATCGVLRNPSHSTLPWTSVAAAILASGSAANASSTTVTAPSVTHTGDHRTVVRIVSSADDNALNAPSSGAAAYGGANYDSTTGNDFAQAMSLREDITVTTNTGTSTFTESLVGPDVSNGSTLVIGIPSGILGLPAETDTARGIVLAAKSTDLGGPSAETDSAPALAGGSKSTAVALVSESDIAPALAGGTKSAVVAAASEADSAVALAGASKTSAPLGLPTSAESALGLAGQVQGTDVAGAPETDTGLPLAGGQKATATGTAAETDTALGLAGAEKRTQLGVALEVDTALPLNAAVLGAGAETDTAPGLAGATKASAVGIATSVEVALPLAGASKLTPVGVATETDQALGLGTAVGTAGEADTAIGLAGQSKVTLLGLATSLEVALPLAGQVKLGPVGIASEVDEALELLIIPDDVPSQGSYDSGSGPLVYDGSGSRVYNAAAGRLIYDP